MRKFLVFILLCVAGAAGAWHFGYLGGTKPAAEQQAKGRRGAGDAAIGVITASVKQMNLPIRQRSFGWVEPEKTVAVKSRVVSQLVDQHFKEGQMVKKGDLLFTLDDRELAAQVAKDEATLARDQALQTRAENDLKRYQQLLEKNAGTQQQFDQATADAKSAAAAVLGDRASLDSDRVRLSYTKIYAPITGRAGAVPITPGNQVSISDTSPALVTITSMDPIRVTFTLPERELIDLQKALAKPDSVPVHVLDAGQVIATGKLAFIDSAVDQSTGTIMAKALFDNPGFRLWPGKYLDVELDTAMHDNALVAPAIAIQQGQKGPYVFVATADKTAELRNVKIGASEGGNMEILEGLAAGEQVVIDGQLRLTNGAKIVTSEASGTKVSQAATTGQAAQTSQATQTSKE